MEERGAFKVIFRNSKKSKRFKENRSKKYSNFGLLRLNINIIYEPNEEVAREYWNKNENTRERYNLLLNIMQKFIK